VQLRPDPLVRITLNKPYADGTLAVDMDPLSLLCPLATSLPPPRFHTVRYAGVLAPASTWRSRIAPKPPGEATPAPGSETPKRAAGYRPWAELLARRFGVDVLACPKCNGRRRLLAMLRGSPARPFKDRDFRLSPNLPRRSAPARDEWYELDTAQLRGQ
jgi:hypothetical protein